MTKKDFEAIANIITYNRSQMGLPEKNESEGHNGIHTGYAVALNDFAIMLADHCRQDNPRFDKTKFLRACGVNC